MTKFRNLAKIYQTFTEAWLPSIEDESGADHLASFFGPVDVDWNEYAHVQREYGWDDTH